MPHTFAANQRGGHALKRPNHRMEARANQLANLWLGRNLDSQSREDLLKARTSLLACGVEATSTFYNRPSRLLNQLNAILDRS